MKVRILQDNSFGGLFTNEFITERWETVVNGTLVSEWNLTDIIPNNEIYNKKWNGSTWIEGATPEEIEAIEDSKYPCTVTALQFELELIYSGLTNDIDNAIESLEEPTKTIVKLKRSKATEFDRKDSFIQQLGQAAGMTKTDISEFFKRAHER